MSMPNHFADVVRSRAFSLTFWIVIFMATVGLADLFVSDRKKQAVQDWFETLTLKMSDIDSTKWPSWAFTKRGSRYVAASSLLPTASAATSNCTTHGHFKLYQSGLGNLGGRFPTCSSLPSVLVPRFPIHGAGSSCRASR
jgi:hypothetical protein